MKLFFQATLPNGSKPMVQLHDVNSVEYDLEALKVKIGNPQTDYIAEFGSKEGVEQMINSCTSPMTILSNSSIVPVFQLQQIQPNNGSTDGGNPVQ